MSDADPDTDAGSRSDGDGTDTNGDTTPGPDTDTDADPGTGTGGSATAPIEATRGGPHDRADLTTADRDTADALAELEAADAVERYVPVVDYDALGLRTAVVRVDTHHGNAGAVADDLREGSGVAVYRTVGRFDVTAVCRYPSAAAYERSLARLASDPRVRAHRASVVRRAALDDGGAAAVRDDES